jgi:hypothetical protein
MRRTIAARRAEGTLDFFDAGETPLIFIQDFDLGRCLRKGLD